MDRPSPNLLLDGSKLAATPDGGDCEAGPALGSSLRMCSDDPIPEAENRAASSQQTRALPTVDETPATQPLELADQERAARLRLSLDTDDGFARGLPASATRIGRYTILRMLAQGGMGVVFSAFDEDLGRRVAVKLLRADQRGDTTSGRSRLLREAQALARLSHPNVIQVHDVGEYTGRVFLAMEYVAGDTLRVWMARGGRPWREVVEIFMQAGRGLAAAHAAGLIHRDFKPDNVLVGADGRVRVLDFGLVRAELGSASGASAAGEVAGEDTAGNSRERTISSVSNDLGDALTRAGTLLGTPAYMPPEQHMRQAVDARGDQFSFCVALYEGLYGERPFAGDDPKTLLSNIRRGAVREAPRGTRVPPWLRRAVLTGLRVDAGERHPSMSALLAAMSRDPATRWRRGLLAVAAIVAVGTSGYGVARWQAGQVAICRGGADRLVGVWDPARRAAVHDAMLATGTPFAQATWTRVAAGIDAYTRGWVTMHRDTCEATNIRGEQSAAALDLRMQCLNERLLEVSALVDVLAAADAKVVENAAQAVGKLVLLDECADAKRLAQLAAPPATVAAQVEAQRGVLARARAEELGGRYPQALVLTSAAVEAARTLGYRPLLAEALLRQGEMLHQAGSNADAVATLSAAMNEAEAIGHADVAADAAIERLYITGVPLAKSEALEESHHVRALVDHAGSELLAGSFEKTLGDVLARQSNLPEAELHFRRAIDLLTDVVGPDHQSLGRIYASLGETLARQGRFDAAIENNERALEIVRAALGPEHPQVAYVLSDRGATYYQQGRLEEALASLKAAHALVERSLGPENPYTLMLAGNVGAALGSMRRFSEAEALFRRSLLGAERHLGPDNPETLAIATNVAITLVELGREDEARRLYTRAITGLERSGDPRLELATPLLHLGRLHLAHGELGAARALVERALAIREGKLGSVDLLVAETLEVLGNIILEQDQLDAAEASFRRANTIRVAILGDSDPSVGLSLVGLGEVSLRRARPKAALVDLERALALLDGASPTPPKYLAYVRYLVGRARAESGLDRAAALVEVRAAVASLRALHDPYVTAYPEALAWLRRNE